MKTLTSWPMLVALVLAASCPLHARDSLSDNFANPPDQTKPRCYWYWMDGQITKEGITRDLEAMKRVGIGEGSSGSNFCRTLTWFEADCVGCKVTSGNFVFQSQL